MILKKFLEDAEFKILERVIVFFPKKKTGKAEYKKGMNETWILYADKDIEYIQIKGAQI